MRETVADKARRYLAEGRLTVTAIDGDFVAGVCRGSGAIHQVGHDPGRGWHCSCASRTDRCAHLLALQLVTVRSARAARTTRTPIEEGRPA